LILKGAGAEGLNLAFTNRVVLNEVWWYAPKELQAIERVYRQGYTRPVIVRQLKPGNSAVNDRKIHKWDNKDKVNKALAIGYMRIDGQPVAVGSFS